MSECLKYFFTSIGVCFTIILILTCLMLIRDFISDLIDDLKWEYKYKHRFDKPPVAKCYCKDCDRYDADMKYCNKFNRYVNDNEFCSRATPLKHDPEN